MKTSVNIAYYTVFVLKVVINCMIKPGQVVLSVTVVNSMENEFHSSLQYPILEIRFINDNNSLVRLARL